MSSNPFPIIILNLYLVGCQLQGNSIKFVKLVEGVGFKFYIKIKEIFKKSIKSKVKLRAKKLVESDRICCYRGLVEGMVGGD